MIPELLKHLGYRSIDDAVELLLSGLCTLPPLLFLGGFIFPGAISMVVLLILVAAVGIHAPPPEPRADAEPQKSKKKPDC